MLLWRQATCLLPLLLSSPVKPPSPAAATAPIALSSTADWSKAAPPRDKAPALQKQTQPPRPYRHWLEPGRDWWMQALSRYSGMPEMPQWEVCGMFRVPLE